MERKKQENVEFSLRSKNTFFGGGFEVGAKGRSLMFVPFFVPIRS